MGLLALIDAHTSVPVLALSMFVLGVGVGMLMQNLVLAAQNDVPASQLGATTSVLTFFRSLGGAIGVSVLGAVLADRVSTLTAERLGTAGGGEVPDLSTLPAPVLRIVQDVYGDATADIFLVGAPIAVLALVAVLFVKEKPLATLSGDQRLAREQGLSH
jgi:MFS family permease